MQKQSNPKKHISFEEEENKYCIKSQNCDEDSALIEKSLVS